MVFGIERVTQYRRNTRERLRFIEGCLRQADHWAVCFSKATVPWFVAKVCLG